MPVELHTLPSAAFGPDIRDAIQVIRLSTDVATAEFISYGATLTKLLVKDKDGIARDVVLGFDDPLDYVKYPHTYFGAVVGRCCNRISNGRFLLNGRTYEVAQNNGPNHLHGGIRGFDQILWKATVIQEDPPSVRFEHTSQDGEEGYPGAVDVIVTCTLENAELSYNFAAKLSDGQEGAESLVNLTTHPFFNLTGFASPIDGTVHDHICQMNADRVQGYLDLTDMQVPTGRVLTPGSDGHDPTLDFLSSPRRFGDGLKPGLDHVHRFGGCDHFFLSHQDSLVRSRRSPTDDGQEQQSRQLGLQPLCMVTAPSTGISLILHTDANGFQLYTGNFLDGQFSAKQTQVHGETKEKSPRYEVHTAFCLEPSAPVDAINHNAWRKLVTIKRGEEWRMKVVYAFNVHGENGGTGAPAVLLSPGSRRGVLNPTAFALVSLLGLCALPQMAHAEGISVHPQFCKCLCGGNSTIVPLKLPQNCADCNIAFCLAMCNDASGNNQLQAFCFERESTKDQVLVILFLITTFGLLAGALLRDRAVQWWKQRRERMTYSSMPT